MATALYMWRRHRQRRAARPFPTPWRRARSVVELMVLIVAVGTLAAAVLGALLVAIVLAGSHLVGG